MMLRKSQLILAAAVIVFLGGCLEDRQDIGRDVVKKAAGPQITGVAIADIMAARETYRGREVIVSGKVLPGMAFEFISEQPYRIIQGESLLWVITNEASPREGDFVTVRGRIAIPYQIKGRSYQMALLEEERL